MNRGQIDRKHIVEYTKKSRKDLVFEIASQAWSWGMPWAEALPIATKAVEAGNPKAKAWPKVKAKAKAKASARWPR